MTLHEKKVLLQEADSYSLWNAVGKTHLNAAKIKHVTCGKLQSMAMIMGWGHMSHRQNCGPRVLGSKVIKMITENGGEVRKPSVISFELKWPLQYARMHQL